MSLYQFCLLCAVSWRPLVAATLLTLGAAAVIETLGRLSPDPRVQLDMLIAGGTDSQAQHLAGLLEYGYFGVQGVKLRRTNAFLSITGLVEPAAGRVLIAQLTSWLADRARQDRVRLDEQQALAAGNLGAQLQVLTQAVETLRGIPSVVHAHLLVPPNRSVSTVIGTLAAAAAGGLFFVGIVPLLLLTWWRAERQGAALHREHSPFPS